MSKDYRYKFEQAKPAPYPAAIEKSRPGFWQKVRDFFHRDPQPRKNEDFQKYLLSDDQLAYSSEQEDYEHIEDEE